MSDDQIQGLREALRFSPNNLPLRVHLAKTLVGLGRWEEAELEYREALALAPHEATLKLGLARVYLQQDKTSQAMVIVENLCRQPSAPAEAFVFYAKLSLREGDVHGVHDAVCTFREKLYGRGSLGVGWLN